MFSVISILALAMASETEHGPRSHPRPLLRLGQLRPPMGVLRRTWLVWACSSLACNPLLAPERVEARVAEWMPSGCAALIAVYRVAHGLRARHTLAILLLHDFMTDVTADITAQVIDARSAGVDSMRINWRRVPRTAIASFISDDIPFLLWSRLLWVGGQRLAAAAQVSELPLVRALGHPAVLAVAKTVATQLVYETASAAAYLALQAALQGRSAAGALRRNLRAVWLNGAAFWSVAHVLVFSLPAWWMQPIMDNLFTLCFNTYLATVAHEPRPRPRGSAAKCVHNS